MYRNTSMVGLKCQIKPTMMVLFMGTLKCVLQVSARVSDARKSARFGCGDNWCHSIPRFATAIDAGTIECKQGGTPKKIRALTLCIIDGEPRVVSWFKIHILRRRKG